LVLPANQADRQGFSPLADPMKRSLFAGLDSVTIVGMRLAVG